MPKQGVVVTIFAALLEIAETRGIPHIKHPTLPANRRLARKLAQRAFAVIAKQSGLRNGIAARAALNDVRIRAAIWRSRGSVAGVVGPHVEVQADILFRECVTNHVQRVLLSQMRVFRQTSGAIEITQIIKLDE
jgi:hypothetical protein